MNLSVIICTHNPREDYLRRALEALRSQTLPQDQWELLLIDNASKEILSEKWDLSWHPNSRHIREEELGLTPARLRGIREAAGEILVFVDDDNILDAKYLQIACEMAQKMPWIGAFNGSCHGEYEIPPQEEIMFMMPSIAVETIDTARWSCRPGLGALNDSPCGAGMVIRHEIAEDYARITELSSIRKYLDRRGGSLISCGDIDMALFACKSGYAIGRFPELSLRHLIGKRRLSGDYLLDLAEAQSASYHILAYLWENKKPVQDNIHHEECLSKRLYDGYLKFRRKNRTPTFAENIESRRHQGRFLAQRILLEHGLVD